MRTWSFSRMQAGILLSCSLHPSTRKLCIQVVYFPAFECTHPFHPMLSARRLATRLSSTGRAAAFSPATSSRVLLSNTSSTTAVKLASVAPAALHARTFGSSSKVASMAPVDDKQAGRPAPDKVFDDIAEYVSTYKIDSEEAWNTARLTLMDTIGCE